MTSLFQRRRLASSNGRPFYASPVKPRPADYHMRAFTRLVLSLLLGACVGALPYAFRKARESSLRQRSIYNVVDTTDATDQSELCHTTVGIMTSVTLFQQRLLTNMNTWIPELCPSSVRILVQVDRTDEKEMSTLLSLVAPEMRRHIFLVESKCPMGYANLCCRTRELMRQMYGAFPDSRWFVKADDDTLLIPKHLDGLLRGLNSSMPLAAGGGTFFSCDPKCTHLRYPKVAWAKRALLEPLLRGGAGYILSAAAVAWINDNEAAVRSYGEGMDNDAEDVMLLRALSNELPGFQVHHLESFYFHRPEVAVRYHNLHLPVRRTPPPPVAFHMMHDLEGLNSTYQFFRDLPTTINVPSPSLDWSANPCTSFFHEMRATIRKTYLPLLAGIKQVAVVGVPDHSNRGDSAIYVGELHLLDDLGISVVYEAYVDRDYDAVELAAAFTVPVNERALILHGGGNWGDLYAVHHKFRLRVLRDFPTVRAVSFPNTLTARSPAFWNETIKVLSEHQAPVVVVGRDKKTAANMTEYLGHLPGVIVKQCTDMAFYIHLDRLDWSPYPSYLFGSLDVLVTSRSDSEWANYPIVPGGRPSVPLSKWSLGLHLKEVASSRAAVAGRSLTPHQANHLFYLSIFTDDWLGGDPPGCQRNISTYRQRAEMRTVDGLAFLRRGKVGLTNRLHAHILMTLMQVPHVVMDTKFDKVLGFHSAYTSSCTVGALYKDLGSATERVFDLLLGDEFLREDWKAVWRS